MTFSGEEDNQTYLRLLRDNLGDTEVRLLGWCMMSNHVHLVAIPGREDSLAVLLRRVHGRYAQYYNTRRGRTGHLWQNRFFACGLSASHLWRALAYVDRNPVRAGTVASAAAYRWSSAVAHLTDWDEFRVIDGRWWETMEPQTIGGSFWDMKILDRKRCCGQAHMQDGHSERRVLLPNSVRDLANNGRVGVRGKMAYKEQQFQARSKR